MAVISPWPELTAPVEARECARCGLAGQRKRVIWGEGTPGAPVMIILDNPGAREDKEGRPFVCGTRLALREAMERGGLRPEDVFLTFLLKCRPIRSYDRESSRSACLPYLKEQIMDMRPRLLVCMGNVVTGTLFSGHEVKDLRGRRLAYENLPALATYHPLAARRRPNLLKLIASDLADAAEYLKRG
ncbi:uracil-DNA glycosylase [Desulfotomaculum copahuensis]|uniref:uracil-DNA glycosylase n=1 Tax=Desulfotomaculum copahuensis TaxID=1838280 RepID=UPI000A88D497|nr:uracil-DNA glycosylase [Desulfotomaculum copahuensis]